MIIDLLIIMAGLVPAIGTLDQAKEADHQVGPGDDEPGGRVRRPVRP